jgi:RHS repeat-associated protein
MTDPSGQVVWRASKTPFGTTTVDEDPDGDGRPLTLNLRFPGQYYDAETGMHYNWHRYYGPNSGTYLKPDPLGGIFFLRRKPIFFVPALLMAPAEIHPYSYVTNKPLNNIDYRGLGPQIPGCDWVPDLTETRCRRRACDEHDVCYLRYNCRKSSWLPGKGGQECNQCNQKLLQRWGRCAAEDTTCGVTTWIEITF